MAAAFFTSSSSSFLTPAPSQKMLLLQGAGAAAGGRVVLLHGAGAGGSALLLGPATALVAVAGGAAARRPRCTAGGGDQRPSDDDTAEHFWGAGGVVVRGDEKLLHYVATVAKESKDLLDRMVKEAPSPLPDLLYQDLVALKMAFVEVEDLCEQGKGCVTSASVEDATRALQTMADVFLGSGAAEVVGPYPKIVFTQDKHAYVEKLASAFSDVLHNVKTAYGQVALPGGGGAATDKQLPDSADDGTAKLFREVLQQTYVGVVVRGDDKLVDDLAIVAKEAKGLLYTMLKEATSPVPGLVYQDIVLLTTPFLTVERQCQLGYATSNTVEAATRALSKMAELFLGSGAAEALGPDPKIVVMECKCKHSSEEDKAAHLRQLATTFSRLLRDVKTAYGGRARH